MFTRVSRITAAIFATGALLLGAGAVQSAPPHYVVVANTTPDVGVQFHGLWASYTDTERTRILDTLRGAGVKTVRIDVSWAMLQPHNGQSFDPWGTAFVDRVIAMANSRGITPLMTLWITPGWANNHAGDHVLPWNVNDYARVAQWAAARYTNKVAGWEVWNEQNSSDFMAGADPGAYTNLLRAAYPAFHAGYGPTTVVFGGLQYNDDTWLARAYAAGAHGYFDVMATHPYQGIANLPPNTPDDGTRWTLTHARAVHNLMVAKGDGAKSLWFTEFGWSSHSNSAGTPNYQLGVSEAVQATDFTATIALLRSTMPWVGKVYWYNDPDDHDSSYDRNNSYHQHRENYSVLRLDLSAKPIMAAISAVTG